jgi:hypothetical protein
LNGTSEQTLFVSRPALAQLIVTDKRILFAVGIITGQGGFIAFIACNRDLDFRKVNLFIERFVRNFHLI